MRVFIILLLFLSVLLGVLAFLWFRSQGKRERGVGFREWVRNPRHRREVGGLFAAREQAVTRLAQRPPEMLVAMLLDDDFDLPKRAVKVAGVRVVPALIAALSDDRFRRVTDASERNSFSRSSPLSIVLECLVDFAPAEAVPLIARLIRDPNEEIRKYTAMLLGAIANDACASPFAVSCQDQDEYVRSYAMMGVLRATKAGRASDGFRVGAFDAILPWLYRRDGTVSGNAPRCLLALDRARAIAIMTSPENLVVGTEGLQYVLGAIREARLTIPQERLLTLATSLERVGADYPNEYVLGEVYALLSHVDSQAAEETIRKGTSAASKEVREAAWKALAARCGIEDPFAHAWKQEELLGRERITPVQRQVLAVRELIDQVNNGGFSQYFVNPYGAQWQDALDGLQAIQSATDAVLFKNVIALFGDRGPSKDDDQRHEELARVVKSKGDEAFSTFDGEFYEDQGDREILLLQFITQHANEFSTKR